MNVKVYALAVYVEVDSAKILAPYEANSSDPALFDVWLALQSPCLISVSHMCMSTYVCQAMLSTDTFFRRMVHMTFARNVTAKQVSDAIGDSLKAHIDPPVSICGWISVCDRSRLGECRPWTSSLKCWRLAWAKV